MENTNLEFSKEQTAQIDAVENSVHELCKVMLKNENLNWDMNMIGDIADAVADVLAEKGWEVHYPAIVTDGDKQYISDTYSITPNDRTRPVPSDMKVIAVVGLVPRNVDEAISILSNDGCVTLNLGYLNDKILTDSNNKHSKMLHNAKLKKIDLADELLIVDEEGRERAHEYLAEYAVSKNKRVKYWSNYHIDSFKGE